MEFKDADEGAGHVAATDEGDGAVCGGGGRHVSGPWKARGSVPVGRGQRSSVSAKATNCVTCKGLKLSSLSSTSVRCAGWPSRAGSGGPQARASVLSSRDRLGLGSVPT